MKGTGFSPYIKHLNGVLAPESKLIQNRGIARNRAGSDAAFGRIEPSMSKDYIAAIYEALRASGR